ncbi:hypothetical protein EAG_03018 [Camponotus floridanus]|uniref:Uncharacterized protein n=1 Tax=Camponotus floridanus TaxID=104421 RepID=E2ARL4_CAMFO|nr:hypothetical protein EAG_03018 [Camponotus floridanus]
MPCFQKSALDPEIFGLRDLLKTLEPLGAVGGFRLTQCLISVSLSGLMNLRITPGDNEDTYDSIFAIVSRAVIVAPIATAL